MFDTERKTSNSAAVQKLGSQCRKYQCWTVGRFCLLRSSFATEYKLGLLGKKYQCLTLTETFF